MANNMYINAKQLFLNGSIDFLGNTIKVALIGASYIPDLTNHKFLSDITSTNIIGTAVTLANKSIAGGVASCDNVTFTTVPGPSTIGYIAIYKDTGTPTTSPLILLIDTATNLPATSNGGDIAIAWDTGTNRLFAI